MKRIIVLVLVIMLVMATGYADERNLGTKCGDFWYDLNDDGTARLTACFNVDETLELPPELDGYPVTVISYQAFLYYSPAKVVIPEGVVEILHGAFKDNDMIISVTLPYSLTVMSSNPFVNCPNLSEIVIPEDHPVFEITDGVLMHREEKRVICPVNGYDETIIIPAGAETIGYGAFYNNSSVSQVRLHDGITKIDDMAFAGCANLNSIVIPPSVEYIGEWALDGIDFVSVYRGSYAEEYCRENEIPFEYFD